MPSFSFLFCATTFDLLPFPLQPWIFSFPTLFWFPALIAVPLSSGGTSFPWGMSGSLTDSLPLPNFVSSSPPSSEIFHRFPLQPCTSQHPQMTQCPPALQPSSISQSESHRHTHTMVCAPWNTHIITVKDLNDSFNPQGYAELLCMSFYVCVCVHTYGQGCLCTCKCSYIYKYVW